MNIIQLAKEWKWLGTEGWKFHTKAELQAFAALVAAQEREACAKLAEETICDVHIPTNVKIYGSRAANAIRARGTT